MKRTLRPRAIPVLAAFALLAVAAPASAATFSAGTTDPVGDSTGGPGSDLAAVDVAYDQAGSASATWTLDTTGTGRFRQVVSFGTTVAGVCGGPDQLFVFADSDGSYAGWRLIVRGNNVDGPGSAPRTAGIGLTRDATKLTVTLNDPSAAGATYNCAKAESADSPADVIVYDAVSPFAAATPPPPPTLAALPGSLLAPTKCQNLGGSGFLQTRTPSGVGDVRLRMRSNATSPPGTPLRLSIVGGSFASVTWTLDGKPVSAPPRLLTLRPAQLASRPDHVVGVTFLARDGSQTTYPLSFKTLSCSSALTVTQSRRGRGATVRLRIDSTSAMSRATFTLPAAVKATTRQVKVRLRAASDDRTRSYTYRVANGRIFKPAGAPTIKGTSSGISLSGLPAQTGILRVDVITGGAPVGTARKPVTLRATAVIRGKATRLRTSATGAQG